MKHSTPRSVNSWRRLAHALCCALLCLGLGAGAAANPQAGLGKPPAGLDLTTPQRTVEFFLTATREGRFEDAAFALDLRGIPVASQPARGAELARQLRYVLDRRLWLDMTTLSDEVGGRPEDGTLTETLGGVPLASSEVSIRLQRVAVAGGSTVWVVSRGTVAAVPQLYEEHGPGAIGERLPRWLHRVSFLQLALWQWLGLLIGIAGSFAISFLATSLALRFARRIAARTVNRIDDALVARARGPLRLLLATAMLGVWIELLRLSVPAAEAASRLVGSLLIVGFTWAVMRVVFAISDVVTQNLTVSDEANEELVRHGHQMRVRVARQAVNAVVFFVGCALLLTQFDMVRKVGVSLLASAGVLTVVIGFAAQKSVANLLAGIQITAAQPIRIGDRVNISGDVGWIEEITLTYVTMKTWDGRRRVFPITYFLDNQFENWTKTSPQKTCVALIHADHRVPVALVRDELMRLLELAPEWDREIAALMVVEVNARTIVLRATASAPDAAAGWDLACRLREQLMDFLQRLEGGRYLPRTRLELPGASPSGDPPEPKQPPAEA